MHALICLTWTAKLLVLNSQASLDEQSTLKVTLYIYIYIYVLDKALP